MFTKAMGGSVSGKEDRMHKIRGKTHGSPGNRAAEVYKVYDRQRMAREALIMPHNSLTFLPFNLG